MWRWSDARATLVDKLGGRWMGGVRMPEYNPCQLAFANGMRVELLEPGTDDSSFLARFLARSGAGPHPVTFKVDDIRAPTTASASAWCRGRPTPPAPTSARVERKTIIVAGCVVYLIGSCLLPVIHCVTGPFDWHDGRG